MAAHAIEGSWQLTRFVQHTEAGDAFPFGADPVGWILYAADGRMSAHIARRSLPLPAGPELVATPSPEQAQAILAGFVSYGGWWTVYEDAATVTHHVDVASHPNMIGRDLVRRYRLDGDSLVLRPPPTTVAGVPSESAVTWQRRRRSSSGPG